MPNGGNRSGSAMTGADATRNPGQNSEPGDIEALLPWYAAGTLRRRDRQRVEDALRQDAEFARHVELVREEIVETIHLNETLGAPRPHVADRLMAAIDAEANAAHKHVPGAIAGSPDFSLICGRALWWWRPPLPYWPLRCRPS
jgi:anti-sigma-K factor RskA